MKTVKIGNGDLTFTADRSNTTYVLEAGKTLDTTYHGIETIEPSLRNIGLVVNGTIRADATGIYANADADPVRSLAISVGKQGRIESVARAIDVDGRDVRVENRGTLAGSEGIRLWGRDGVVDNAGVVDAASVGIVAADGARVVNAGTISGGMYGIVLNALEGMGGLVKNTGTIAGGDHAVYGSTAADRIVNSGFIDGEVRLRDGDDVIVFKGGIADHAVHGGAGDDLFVVRSPGPVIKEVAGEGDDTVRSSISWTIGDNIETLQLTGRNDLDGFGNATANRVTGNAGDNALYGRAGDDTLRGGAGNDVLTGDAGSDVFVFARGAGRDTVTDFEAGIDGIQLGGFKGARDFADMLAGHLEVKGDDLWITYGNDVIVLEDTTEAELQAGDFVF